MSNDRQPKNNKLISKSDWQYITILLGIGFLTRLVFFSQIYLISIDGAFQYIPVAKLFAWGEYWEALHQPQMPLFPYLTSIFTKMTGNFEISGQLISIISSILAVIPLFLLGKLIFGETAAFWAGIFYFLNPEMLQRSVDVLQEGLIIFLLFHAVFFFYLFLNQRRIFWLVASTLLTLLGMLTRVVSLIFIPVFIFWILFLKKKYFDVGPFKRLRYMLVVLILCAAIVVPHIINVKAVTGKWDVSKKGATVRMLIQNIPYGYPLNKMGDFLEIVVQFLSLLIPRIIKVYHPILFIFLLAGIIRRKCILQNFPMEMFLFSFIFGYFVIIGLMLNTSQRYIFFPILISYLWAGAGAVEVQDKVVRRVHLSPNRVTIGLFIFISIVFLPILLNPYRVEKLGRKAVGFLIKEQEIGKPVIMTDAHLVAYYAEGDLLEMDNLNYKRNISEAREKGIEYIVVEEKRAEKDYPQLTELAKEDFILQKVFQLPGKHQEKYLVFKIRD
jgi:hypothetical protein